MTIASVIEGNKQVLLFIQGLLEKKDVKQKETITCNVKDKQEEIPFVIEINENTTGRFILYRVVTSAGEGLWQSWESADDVERSFKHMSLI